MVHLPDGCAELVVREVVEFGNNSTRIRRRSRPLLTSLAAMLSLEEPAVLLLGVEGYQAENEAEEGLAHARALAVQAELLALGAHPSRVVALGHEQPLWARRDAQWSPRRVEFDVLLYGRCT